MVKFLSSKRGITSRKKNQNFMWICISTWYVPHNYIALRHSVGRLQRSCADKTNRTVGLSFWSNFWSSKWALFREKKWIKFPVDMHIYTICSSKLQSFTTFCCVVSEELRWQEKQDCLTDWLTDWLMYGSKTLYPP